MDKITTRSGIMQPQSRVRTKTQRMPPALGSRPRHTLTNQSGKPANPLYAARLAQLPGIPGPQATLSWASAGLTADSTQWLPADSETDCTMALDPRPPGAVLVRSESNLLHVTSPSKVNRRYLPPSPRQIRASVTQLPAAAAGSGPGP